MPKLAVIDRVVEETWDTKTFRAVFADAPLRERFAYHPGQFQEVSVFGVGEATFCLTSSPTRAGFIEFSAKKVGAVTSALHDLVRRRDGRHPRALRQLVSRTRSFAERTCSSWGAGSAWRRCARS